MKLFYFNQFKFNLRKIPFHHFRFFFFLSIFILSTILFTACGKFDRETNPNGYREGWTNVVIANPTNQYNYNIMDQFNLNNLTESLFTIPATNSGIYVYAKRTSDGHITGTKFLPQGQTSLTWSVPNDTYYFYALVYDQVSTSGIEGTPSLALTASAITLSGAAQSISLTFQTLPISSTINFNTIVPSNYIKICSSSTSLSGVSGGTTSCTALAAGAISGTVYSMRFAFLPNDFGQSLIYSNLTNSALLGNCIPVTSGIPASSTAQKIPYDNSGAAGSRTTPLKAYVMLHSAVNCTDASFTKAYILPNGIFDSTTSPTIDQFTSAAVFTQNSNGLKFNSSTLFMND